MDASANVDPVLYCAALMIEATAVHIAQFGPSVRAYMVEKDLFGVGAERDGPISHEMVAARDNDRQIEVIDEASILLDGKGR